MLYLTLLWLIGVLEALAAPMAFGTVWLLAQGAMVFGAIAGVLFSVAARPPVVLLFVPRIDREPGDTADEEERLAA